MLVIAGGAMVLPACLRPSGRETISLDNLTIDEEAEDLLAAITETLIPATDTPGGRELRLHYFVLKMVDDCHGPKDQAAFEKGLAAFEELSRHELDVAFAAADQVKREALLRAVQEGEAGGETVAEFYRIVKRRTTQGYMNSKYVMTNLVMYELAPGRYDGYAPA